jgi:hypothetical protein
MNLRSSQNIHDYLWARRLALYFSLGAGVIVILHVIFSFFGFLHTDVDSARYMLSALIQSEAAIVALVVTLSLVAVQLAAQSYSARVIEVFRRAPDLWILMGIYGIAIFYGLGVLKLIEMTNPQLCNKDFICLSNLEEHIAFSYYLGVFAFVALVPYIWNTLELLKPSSVINMLAEKITKKNLLINEEILEREDLNRPIIDSEKDPIQPIIDIVHGSMIKHDFETVRYGLRKIENCVYNMIENETFEETDEIRILYLFEHLERIGVLAVNMHDEYSVNAVLDTIFVLGKLAAKKRLEIITINAMISLKKIGNITAQQKLDDTTFWVIDDLGEIGLVASEQELVKASRMVVNCLQDILKIAKENELEKTKKEAENYINQESPNDT